VFYKLVPTQDKTIPVNVPSLEIFVSQTFKNPISVLCYYFIPVSKSLFFSKIHDEKFQDRLAMSEVLVVMLIRIPFVQDVTVCRIAQRCKRLVGIFCHRLPRTGLKIWVASCSEALAPYASCISKCPRMEPLNVVIMYVVGLFYPCLPKLINEN